MQKLKKLNGKLFLIILLLFIVSAGICSFEFSIDNEMDFLLLNYQNRSILPEYHYKYQKLELMDHNELLFLGEKILTLYRFLISSQDEDICMFHPHCSLYARLSFRRYGFFKGLLLSSDRLLRCNGVGSSYYFDAASDGKFFDEPEKNYLWEK